MSSIRAENINHPGYTEPLNNEKYQHIKKAMLLNIPSGKEGITVNELVEKVDNYLKEKNVPEELFPKKGSVTWYVKAVQLDLEAKSIIQRIPGVSPIRLIKK